MAHPYPIYFYPLFLHFQLIFYLVFKFSSTFFPYSNAEQIHVAGLLQDNRDFRIISEQQKCCIITKNFQDACANLLWFHNRLIASNHEEVKMLLECRVTLE